MVLAFGEPREGVVDALDRPGARAHAAGKPQMLVDAERTPEPTSLRHIADTEPRDMRGWPPCDILAADADRAAADRYQAHDRLAQRGLAHAVAADDGEHAGIERKIDALQGV